jgi:hypothetical protein
MAGGGLTRYVYLGILSYQVESDMFVWVSCASKSYRANSKGQV